MYGRWCLNFETDPNKPRGSHVVQGALLVQGHGPLTEGTRLGEGVEHYHLIDGFRLAKIFRLQIFP